MNFYFTMHPNLKLKKNLKKRGSDFFFFFWGGGGGGEGGGRVGG